MQLIRVLGEEYKAISFSSSSSSSSWNFIESRIENNLFLLRYVFMKLNLKLEILSFISENCRNKEKFNPD